VRVNESASKAAPTLLELAIRFAPPVADIERHTLKCAIDTRCQRGAACRFVLSARIQYSAQNWSDVWSGAVQGLSHATPTNAWPEIEGILDGKSAPAKMIRAARGNVLQLLEAVHR
jgi:hypothetical protein